MSRPGAVYRHALAGTHFRSRWG